MRAVTLLPAYTRHYLPESITTRPVKGEVPTLDLVIAYHKSTAKPSIQGVIVHSVFSIFQNTGVAGPPSTPLSDFRHALGWRNCPSGTRIT
jgi:hypothetical protein